MLLERVFPEEGSVKVCTEGHLPEDEDSWGATCFGFGTALNARACYSTEFCELEY